MSEAVAIPAAINAEMKRQSDQPMGASAITPYERETFLQSLPVEFQTEGEEHLNRIADQDERQRWEFLEGAVINITNLLRQADRFQRPLLTMEDAAAMLSLTRKRLDNIIIEERARIGRTPDFVVNADGRIQRRILRDELLDWAKGRRKRGAPPRSGRWERA